MNTCNRSSPGVTAPSSFERISPITHDFCHRKRKWMTPWVFFFLSLTMRSNGGFILAWKHGKRKPFLSIKISISHFLLSSPWWPKVVVPSERFFGGLGFSTDSFCTSYLRCFLVANIREDGPLANDPRWTWQGLLVSGNCGNCQPYWMLLGGIWI